MARVPADVWPERARGLGAYIAVHWRGGFSLPRAYWVNNVLVTLVVSLLMHGLAAAVTPQIRVSALNLALAWGAAGVTVFSLPVTVWQAVGVWRSASNRTRYTGKAGWSVVAKILVVLALLATPLMLAANIQRNAGLYTVMVAATFDIPLFAEYTVARAADGRTLKITGPLAFGVADRVEAALAGEGDTVSRLRLNSPGGRLSEAFALRDIVRAHGLETRVRRRCYSACTLVFLAAEQRIVTRGAELGFHRSARSVRMRNEMADRLRRLARTRTREAMTAAGVAPAFIDRALSTPHDELFRPSTSRLVRAGVATHVLVNGAARPVE